MKLEIFLVFFEKEESMIPLSKRGLLLIQIGVAIKTLGLKEMLTGKPQDFSRVYASMLAEAREICSRKNPLLVLEIKYLLSCWGKNFNELTAYLP